GALGRIGMKEDEAKKSGRKILRAKMPMARVGRAREAGETQGFMKVIVDADSKELLGAAILGLNGDEIVHSLLDVMYAKKPYTTIQRAAHIHPTLTELVPTLLVLLKPRWRLLLRRRRSAHSPPWHAAQRAVREPQHEALLRFREYRCRELVVGDGSSAGRRRHLQIVGHHGGDRCDGTVKRGAHK